MIQRRTVLWLGLAQLVCWGTTYYLIGAFGGLIAAELGWSSALVHGGFSAALLVMGLASPVVGRMIDRHGGRPVMAAGSVLAAAGCAGIAVSQDPVAYYAAFLCLGIAMRCTLYDAGFAALARIGGVGARRAMAQITLLGGLASTVFWPLGHLLADRLGWRGALAVYAALALATMPLHLALPRGRVAAPAGTAPATTPAPLAASRRDQLVAGGLYAALATLVSALNTAMSAHMIGLLAGLGLAAGAAVSVASLRGIGQTSARGCEVLFGGRLHPLGLNLIACVALPTSFAIGLWSGELLVAACVFALLYGAGNGLATITRGTLPLVLFDPGRYGSLAGGLLAPSFILSAAAPLAYAWVIDRFGDAAGMHLSIGIAALACAAGLALSLIFGRKRKPRAE